MQPFSSCQSPMKEGRERRGRKQKKGRLEAWEKSRPWVTSATKGLNNRMAQSTWTIVVAFPRQGRTVEHFFFLFARLSICPFLTRNFASEKPAHTLRFHRALLITPLALLRTAGVGDKSDSESPSRSLCSLSTSCHSDLTWLNRHSWLWCFLQLH